MAAGPLSTGGARAYIPSVAPMPQGPGPPRRRHPLRSCPASSAPSSSSAPSFAAIEIMFGLFRSLFRRDPRRELVAGLYARVAGAARQRALYADLGVPDTVEGRFEALSVHMVLALRALRHKPDPAGDVARDLTDAFFRDLDASLREMGVGDTAVPKRMKTLAEAFYGRAGVYDSALDAGDEAALAAALGRNVCGSDAPAPGLARYALSADRALKSATAEAFLHEGPRFPAPADFAASGTTPPAGAL